MISTIGLLIDSSVFLLGVAIGWCVGWLGRVTSATITSARAERTLNDLIRMKRK